MSSRNGSFYRHQSGASLGGAGKYGEDDFEAEESMRTSSRRSSSSSARENGSFKAAGSLSSFSASRPSSLYPDLDGDSDSMLKKKETIAALAADYKVSLEEEEAEEEKKQQQQPPPPVRKRPPRNTNVDVDTDPIISSVRSSFASRKKCSVSKMYPEMSTSLYPDISSIKESSTMAPSTLPTVNTRVPMRSSAVAYANLQGKDDDDESSDLIILAKDVRVERAHEDEDLDRKPAAVDKAFLQDSFSSSRNSSDKLYPDLSDLEEHQEKPRAASKPKASLDDDNDDEDAEEKEDKQEDENQESDGEKEKVLLENGDHDDAKVKDSNGDEKEAHNGEKKKKKKHKKKKKKHHSSSKRRSSSMRSSSLSSPSPNGESSRSMTGAAAAAAAAAAAITAGTVAATSSPSNVGDVSPRPALSSVSPPSDSGRSPPAAPLAQIPPSGNHALSNRSINADGDEDERTQEELVAAERAREPRSMTPGAVMIPGSRSSRTEPGQASERSNSIPPSNSNDNDFLSEEDRMRKTLTPPMMKAMLAANAQGDDDEDSHDSSNSRDQSKHNDEDKSQTSSVDEEEGIVKATMVDNLLVPEAEAVTERDFYRRRYCWMAVAALAVIAIAVGLSLGLRSSGSDSSTVFVDTTPAPTAITDSPTMAPTATPPPTLEAVLAEGVLRCGVTNKIGFSIENQITGSRVGFDIDLCRAVAAAVLGDPDAIETTVLSGSERFIALRDREVDLLARVTTHTMERDVHEKNSLVGFSFAAPYLYDGLGFGGVPEFVQCADTLTTFGECFLLNVCVLESTTHIDVLSLRLPMGSLTPVDSRATLYQNLIDGVCNVIAAEQFDVAEQVVRDAGYSGAYQVGANRFSKEPLAMVVRERDHQWHDFVSWVFQSLLIAEANGITSATANLFPTTDLFGPEFLNMYRNAIGAVGNYGELYQRHLEAIVPREGLNTVNMLGNTGLIYSFPFGTTSLEGPEAQDSGTIQAIRDNGKLRCGIIQRPGMGQLSGVDQWSGLDADFCRALAAAVFVGTSAEDIVEFVEVQNNAIGLLALSSNSVDVLAGGEVTYRRDVLDSSAEEGFVFSPPYFYYPAGNTTADPLYGETLSLVTRQDDPEWADFCYWIVHATFFAEETKISQSNSFRMPEIHLYGPACKEMFRIAIGTVGNYGEMYARSVEAIFPRGNSSNMLNSNPVGPQQYPLPGLI